MLVAVVSAQAQNFRTFSGRIPAADSVIAKTGNLLLKPYFGNVNYLRLKGAKDGVWKGLSGIEWKGDPFHKNNTFVFSFDRTEFTRVGNESYTLKWHGDHGETVTLQLSYDPSKAQPYAYHFIDAYGNEYSGEFETILFAQKYSTRSELDNDIICYEREFTTYPSIFEILDRWSRQNRQSQ